jgi:cell division protein YceG involved in septum cleavage
MIKNRNNIKFIQAIVVLLIIIVATIGTVLILTTLLHRDTSTTPNTTSETTVLNVATLEKQAQAAIKNNEVVKAKALLQQVRRIYIDTKNLDGTAGTDAQLYLLDHPRP